LFLKTTSPCVTLLWTLSSIFQIKRKKRKRECLHNHQVLFDENW
jgi:hypothetical protein